MSNLTEILKSATQEQIQKAGACKTADEILAFAKSEKIDITAEQAEEILKMLNPPSGELTDEEMDNVAGGEHKASHTMTCPYCNYMHTASNPMLTYTGMTYVACPKCQKTFIAFGDGTSEKTD